MRNNQKLNIGLSLAWSIILLIRLISLWEETKWFLFDQPRMSVGSLEPVEPVDVWMASQGTWMFFGLIFFTGVLVKTLFTIWKMKNEAEQGKSSLRGVPRR